MTDYRARHGTGRVDVEPPARNRGPAGVVRISFRLHRPMPITGFDVSHRRQTAARPPPAIGARHRAEDHATSPPIIKTAPIGSRSTAPRSPGRSARQTERHDPSEPADRVEKYDRQARASSGKLADGQIGGAARPRQKEYRRPARGQASAVTISAEQLADPRQHHADARRSARSSAAARPCRKRAEKQRAEPTANALYQPISSAGAS